MTVLQADRGEVPAPSAGARRPAPHSPAAKGGRLRGRTVGPGQQASRPAVRRCPDDSARRRTARPRTGQFLHRPQDVVDVPGEARRRVRSVRRRLNAPRSQLLSNDASFLLYALLDAIVDHCFPVLEHYGNRLEELENELLTRPTEALHSADSSAQARAAALPARDVADARGPARLQRESHECLRDTTRMYLRDVYDHMIQIIELCETYRELAHGLTETYMSSLSIRMNEVMKVLTMIATIFIPDHVPGRRLRHEFSVLSRAPLAMGVSDLLGHLRQRRASGCWCGSGGSDGCESGLTARHSACGIPASAEGVAKLAEALFTRRDELLLLVE